MLFVRRQDQLYWGSQRLLSVMLKQIGLAKKSKIKLGLERSSVGKVLALQANDLSLVSRTCVQVAKVAHVCNPALGRESQQDPQDLLTLAYLVPP